MRRATRRGLVYRLGAREQCQQVDDVLLGLCLDAHLLMTESGMQRIAKVFAKISNRNDPSVFGVLHRYCDLHGLCRRHAEKVL